VLELSRQMAEVLQVLMGREQQAAGTMLEVRQQLAGAVAAMMDRQRQAAGYAAQLVMAPRSTAVV